MDDTATVNPSARKRSRKDPPLSLRYSVRKRKLLESIQAIRGDKSLSDTVEHALDRLLEEHYPGCTIEAA